MMNRSEQVLEGQFFFDPADPIYTDHFPGSAVVPGSLIVQAFMTAAVQIQGAEELAMVENFRFKRFVSPGTFAFRIALVGGREDRARLQCTLYNGSEAVVTGNIR